MKNKHITIVALAAAALATSCASEDIAEPLKQKQNQGEPKTVTLTASVNEAQTRVGMIKGENNTASFYWHNGDAISVLTLGTSGYSPEKLTTTDETKGTSSATFTGALTGTMLSYALYPHNEEHNFSISGTTVTVTYNLPASYTYTTVDGNIFPKAGDGKTTYTSNSTNIPMYGTIADGEISFKHIGGLAVIRIDEMPVESGTLTVTADQQLSGDFKVSGLTSTPNIATATIDTEADKKVTFTFSGATANGVGVFYLPLAVGDYTNVKFEIKDKSTNTWWMSSYSTLSIARAGVTAVSLASTDMGKIVKNADGTYTINNHVFVDLGLDVLWAKTNVGADTETAIGSFFAWGETATKTDFSGSSYTLPGTSTLDAEHDAATVQWGAGVRMPTKADFQELINGCSGKSWDGTKKGYTFTNNDQSVFLPVTGAKTYYNGNIHVNTGYGCYWTSSYYKCQYSSDYAYYFEFGSTFGPRTASNDYKCSGGLAVRPVADKPTVSE